MKKIAFLIVALLLTFAIVGCEKEIERPVDLPSVQDVPVVEPETEDVQEVPVDEPEVEDVQDTSAVEPEVEDVVEPEIKADYKEVEIVTFSDGLLTCAEGSYTSEELSLLKVKKIFKPLLEKGIEVYENIRNAPNFEFSENPDFIQNKHDYYYVSEFESIDDVWEMAYSAYTRSAADRLFSEALDQTGENPRYLERDGKVYCHRAAHGRMIDYLYDTLEIEYQCAEAVAVSIDALVNGDLERDVIFVMQKTSDGWRLENSEFEKYTNYFANKIYLKEPDGNTKIYNITLDAAALPTVYQPDATVSSAEFEWGEYIPMVRYAVERYSRHSNAYKFAFLNESTETFDEGNAIWKKLNDKYLVTHPEINLTDYGDAPVSDTIYEFLTQSKITRVSEDMSTLGRMRYVRLDEESTDYSGMYDWSAEYDIIENGEVIETITLADQQVLYDVTPDVLSKPTEGQACEYEDVPEDYYERWQLSGDDTFGFSKSVSDKEKIYRVYERSSGTCLKEIRLNGNGARIDKMIDKRYLLIEQSTLEFDKSCQGVYLFDMEENTLRLLEDFAENVNISPDFKYITYTHTDADNEWASYSGWDKASEGTYLKNLETDETVFFPLENSEKVYWSGNEETVCWVKREALDNAIKE